MLEQKRIVSKNFTNTLLLLLIIAIVIYFVTEDLQTSVSIILAFVGLGLVIFVHELGHFIAGKLCDINVEAFAIGFGPIVLGVKRIENFLQFRILPTMLEKANDPEGLGLLCFRLPMRGKAGETEYQLRIFPVGGFVKLLGQEDVGADKPSDDPRSFVNKPIWKRIVVAAAGVTFNVILAVIFFVVVFTIGIKMPAPVVGDVVPGMPADKAGLEAGDRIISVNGETDIDFTTIAMAAALSSRNEAIGLKIEHRDGTIEDIEVKPVASDKGIRAIGIREPETLEIAKVRQPNELYVMTGLLPGDKIVAANGKEIKEPWQFKEIVKDTLESDISVEIQRAGQAKRVQTRFKLGLLVANNHEVKTDADLGNIYSVVPRLKIVTVAQRKIDIRDRLKAFLARFNIIKLSARPEIKLLTGDIIIKVSDVNNPTFLELRTLINEYAQRYMPITVLRNDVVLAGEIKVVKDSGRFVIGIVPELDVAHPVVAKTVQTVGGYEPLAIPSGAEIISIDDEETSNFYDIIRMMKASKGKEIKLEYRIADSDKTDTVIFKVPQDEAVGVSSSLVSNVPFKPLENLIKADEPVDAIKIGCQKTVMFIAQTYITLKGLIFRTISPKALMGPVGMIATSSKVIAEREFIVYFYFMGLISACLAVMNFLPLPILDGGLIVLLIIEKIKGSPVHIKVQEWLTYAGLAVIGALFIMITYNDIIRVFFNK